MNKLLTTLVLFFSGYTFSSLSAQQIQAAGFHNVDMTQKLCARVGARQLGMVKAYKEINQILSVVRLKYNGRILECPEFGGKVLAYIDEGERWIAYDVDLMETADSMEVWVSKGILAHELAHHLHGHTLYHPHNLALQRNEELDADNWAGYILGKLGATKQEAILFLNAVEHPTCEEEGFVTHPCKSKRKEEALKGWQDAQKEGNIIYEKLIRDTVVVDNFTIDTIEVLKVDTLTIIDTLSLLVTDTIQIVKTDTLEFYKTDTIKIINTNTDTIEVVNEKIVNMEDRDHDGLSNDIDNCPDEPGPKETFGCPLPVEDNEMSSISSRMIFVEGGTFSMGCTNEQGNICDDDELPLQKTTLNDFYINKFEVTQSQWEHIMGKNPSNFGDCPACPVEDVSWKDVEQFIEELNKKTGRNYRLPTEAEWEFAARGGTQSKGFIFSGSNDIKEVAWYDENAGETSHPVGTKMPNELGLYDMSGNVWEWCSDWYADYHNQAQINPIGANNGTRRINRGGCWYFNQSFCRVSDRVKTAPKKKYFSLGFRLAASSMN